MTSAFDHEAKQATPHAQLIAEIMDSRVAKNEREWAAAREIERLRAELEAAKRDAERYRWMMERGPQGWPHVSTQQDVNDEGPRVWPIAFTEAIDFCMAHNIAKDKSP